MAETPVVSSQQAHTPPAAHVAELPSPTSGAQFASIKRMRHPSVKALIASAACLISWRCAPEPTASDGGVVPDAGMSDAGAATDAGGTPPDAGTDAGGSDSGTPSSDGGLPATLQLQCAATLNPPQPNPCPTPSLGSGQAEFCFRSQWAGVTSVDVYGGFGQAMDWKMPFLTLTNDGTGTFTGSTPLANGSYPYVFRTNGSADSLVSNGHYFLDQENPQFEPAPAGAPDQRSVSVITVPQLAPTLVHLKGSVVFEGLPQSCFSVDLEAGEMVDGGHVISEHDTANFAESLADGTFDFPVAAQAPYMVVIRFPFLLAGTDAGYPKASTTPSVGTARTTLTVGAADWTLNPTDISYPLDDYAALTPQGGTATLPVTFTLSVVPGSFGAQVSVTSTDIAGNDPSYSSGFSTATEVTWDGGFNGGNGGVKAGTTYYWGAWQMRPSTVDGGVTWTSESLLFPITFP
jgi:hypothetical protein